MSEEGESRESSTSKLVTPATSDWEQYKQTRESKRRDSARRARLAGCLLGLSPLALGMILAIVWCMTSAFNERNQSNASSSQRRDGGIRHYPHHRRIDWVLDSRQSSDSPACNECVRYLWANVEAGSGFCAVGHVSHPNFYRVVMTEDIEVAASPNEMIHANDLDCCLSRLGAEYARKNYGNPNNIWFMSYPSSGAPHLSPKAFKQHINSLVDKMYLSEKGIVDKDSASPLETWLSEALKSQPSKRHLGVFFDFPILIYTSPTGSTSEDNASIPGAVDAVRGLRNVTMHFPKSRRVSCGPFSERIAHAIVSSIESERLDR